MRMYQPTLATTTALAFGLAVATLPAAASAWSLWGDAGNTSFREYLAQRYFTLATGESQDWEIEDSLYLSAAGVAALNGHPIAPHPLEGVMIVSSKPGELQSARDFLLNVQANGAETKMPVPFANALSAFDCWVEEQEAEPNAAHNLQQCKLKYLRNAQLLSSLQTSAKPAPVVAVVPENLRTLHSVFFDWDKSNLSAAAKDKLEAARAMLSDVNNGKLIISGYADASGSRDYNQRLSERRVHSVAEYLKLPADRFETRVYAFGEDRLHVPTKDGVREPRNRVVDISVNATRYDVEQIDQ